jgi:serine/threonine protein kinase
MKISIGSYTFEIHFLSHSSKKKKESQWAEHMWSVGVSTCEHFYGTSSGALEKFPTDWQSPSELALLQNKVNLIIEEMLPNPKTHREVALQGFIRRCLTVNPQQHSPLRNIFEQYIGILYVNLTPYQLPDPKHIPLLPMLSSMGDFGRSLIKNTLDQPSLFVSMPFIDYLKAGHVQSYSTSLAERVYEEFQEKEMHWLHSCQLVDHLLFSVLGLYHLLIRPERLKGKIAEAVKNQGDQIQKSIIILRETLEELEDYIVPESGGLSHAQLLSYQRYANTQFEKIKKNNKQRIVQHHSRHDSKLSHAVTLDPLNNRFFVHLKKKGLINKALHRESNRVDHYALMVFQNKLILVHDIVKKQNGSSHLSKEIIELCTKTPYLIDPPLAYTQYTNIPSTAKKMASFHMNFLKNLVVHCDGKLSLTNSSERITVLKDFSKGLYAIHNAGYLHGNITPENLLLKPIKNSSKQGVIGSLDMLRKVDEHGKLPLVPVIGINGNPTTFPDGRPKMQAQKFLGDKRYAPPECFNNIKEPQSQSGDIWSFGLMAWQYIYGKSVDDFPFSLKNKSEALIFTQEQINNDLKEHMPNPKTIQESSLQGLIKHCLILDPKKRLSSADLVMETDCVKRALSYPIMAQMRRTPSVKELLQPFETFERQGMGIRSGSQVVRTLRKTKSYLQLPGQSVGHRSLPAELFEMFCEQGKLKLRIDEVENHVNELSKKQAVSIDELEETDYSFTRTFRVIDKLARIIDRFKPTHAEILESQRESLTKLCERLHQFNEIILKTSVLDAGGLTYGQIGKYRNFYKKKEKIYKKPLGFFDETHLNLPISFHFDKESEEELEHAATFDPIVGSLIVHIKKTGTHGKELGKGAEKSVHESIMLLGEKIQKIADVVIRLDCLDVEEERLKHLFTDCPYIEDPAEALTVYDKEETPGMWKNKKNLNATEIEQVKKSAEKVMVRKVAFFPPLYTSSLGGFSYRKGNNRSIPLLVSLMGNVAIGLSIMHEHKYIHRDIKPGNVLIKTVITNSKTEHIGVLADLGEAVFVGSSGVLSTGKPMSGTKHYNSPEVCYPIDHKKYQNQSFASDIWAFGIMMCQALYGNSGRDIPFLDNNSKIHLFTQLKSLTQELIIQSLTKRFPTNPNTNENKLHAIIFQCLAIDPAKRPTAKKLATDLSKLRL